MGPLWDTLYLFVKFFVENNGSPSPIAPTVVDKPRETIIIRDDAKNMAKFAIFTWVFVLSGTYFIRIIR